MPMCRRPRHNDTQLTVAEQHFLANYIKIGNLTDAVLATPELQDYAKDKPRNTLGQFGKRMLERPLVNAEYIKMIEEARKATVATAQEVMEYFTKVMRGEEKDQFGLDAPLSEKTKAAQELAKRTIDIENREAGKADNVVQIKLDWSREE